MNGWVNFDAVKKLIRIHILFLGLLLAFRSHAQQEAFVHEGEVGLTMGAAHYFGDLNNRMAVNRPKPSVGIFLRKQFGNYVGLRVSAHLAQLGYSDKYSDVEFNRRRNLSFNSRIFEMAIQGDFNFFRFQPGNPDHAFTPYVTIGAGIFNFDPYAYLNDQKYYLRPLGTEGQGSNLYPDRKYYDKRSFCFPIGMGIKYNLGNKLNLTFEISHRFTRTDYLDDVSTTYAGPLSFPTLPGGLPSPAFLLQDRSYDYGIPIGEAGRQRGFSAQKDQYVFIEMGLSFSIISYRCPK